MLYGSDTKLSYTACQRIHAEVRVLNEKDKKTRAYFLVDGYEPVDVIAMDIRV